MKLALVHTPSVWVTSIPLGLAYLKAYLAREQPEVRVRILDLNNRFFRDARGRLGGLCARCPRQADVTCVPPELFFRGEALAQAEQAFYDSATFHDKERYAEAFALHNEHYSWAMRCLDTVLKPFVARPDARLDPAVRALLRPDLDAIAAEAPDLVGFSAMTMQISYSLALAKLVKEELGVPVVLGGHFVSVYDPAEVMRANPFLDYIIYKEGERGLAGLVKNLDTRTFADVPNLVYRAEGQVVVNKEGWVNKLDELPFPDLSDYDLSSYFSPTPVVPMLHSRGCHWGRCAFCEEKSASAKYRARTPKNVVDEMEARQRDHGVKHFLFCDQTITATSLERLADEILARGLEVRYGFSGFYASRQVTRELLEKAHASGCRWLYIGVESLTQRLIALMDKGTESGHLLDVIRWCRELGILPFASYFFGFPTQTAEEVKEEARLAKEHAAYFTLPGDGGEFYLTRDSDIYRHPEKYSVDELETHVSFATATGTITSISPRYRAPGLSGAQAKKLFLETVGDDYPYEAGAFWSHFVLLGDNNVDLVFPRAYYRSQLARPLRRLAEGASPAPDPHERGPHVAKVSYHLGLALAAEGLHADALPPLRRAAELAPDSPAALRALATSELAAGEPDAALRAAERALACSEPDLGLEILVASCHERRGDRKAALEIYRQLARRFPSKIALFRQVGRLSRLVGDEPSVPSAEPAEPGY
ncbi:MAG: radical SAM protein [Myxococcales bacterium]|nr:radical SAM protein [Myxococcales bacterium]